MKSLSGLVILCAALASCAGTLVKDNLKSNMQCGTMSHAKTTLIQNPSTLPKRCVYSFTRYSPDVTQVRIEMKELQLMQPKELMDQPDQRQCVDHLRVNDMVLCGNNDGQHLYIQFGTDQYLNIVFDLPLGDSVTSWKLNVTQLESTTPQKKHNKPFHPLQNGKLGNGLLGNGFLANGLQSLKNTFSVQPKDNSQFLSQPNGLLGSGLLPNGPLAAAPLANGPLGNRPLIFGPLPNGPLGGGPQPNGLLGNAPLANGPLPNGPLGNGALGGGLLPNGPLPNGPLGGGLLPNGPLGNAPLPNGPLPNGSLGNGPVGGGPLPNGPLGSGPLPNGPLGSGPLPNAPLGNGPLGSGPIPMAPLSNGPLGSGPLPNGPLGDGPRANGLLGNGPLANALQNFKKPFSAQTNDADVLAPAGCSQYFTDRTGTVESFNYNGGDGPYMSNQSYTICFKNYPDATRVELTFAHFGLPNEGAHLGFDLDCHATIPTLGRQEDYLVIPGATATVGATEIHPTYFCGTTTSGKTVSFGSLGPFAIYFVSDGLVSGDDKGFKINYKIV